MAASTELIEKNKDIEKADDQYRKDMDEAKKETDPAKKSEKEDAAIGKYNEAVHKARKKYQEAKDEAKGKLKEFVNKQVETKEKHPEKQIDLGPLTNMLALVLEAGTLDKAILKQPDKCKNSNCPETANKDTTEIKCKNADTCKCECYPFVTIGGTEFKADALIQGADVHSCPTRVRAVFAVNCRCAEKN